jgi:SAM-dependent methyltransferase
MGDLNQLRFVEKHAERFHGPYLEVGSRDYGSTPDLTSVLKDSAHYVRADMLPGPGVDVVLDMTLPLEELDAQLGSVRFGTIFCLSVLEHCQQPFLMAENLTRLLAPGGRLCISVPFAWENHAYPSDYWRFTREGIEALFPELVFEPDCCASATSKDDDFHPIDEQTGKIVFATKWHFKRGRILRGIVAKTLRLLGKIGLLSWLAGYPYVLAPTNLMMIGTLESTRHEPY